MCIRDRLHQLSGDRSDGLRVGIGEWCVDDLIAAWPSTIDDFVEHIREIRSQ